MAWHGCEGVTKLIPRRPVQSWGLFLVHGSTLGESTICKSIDGSSSCLLPSTER